MKRSRAIVTHFDGDPFLLNFWLKLYSKYWRGEVDRVYMSVYYNKEIIPESVVTYNKNKLAQYPEIVVSWRDEWDIPEKANQETLKSVTEEYIGFIESDGFVYGSGIVDQCFRLLENEGQDIVAPRWELIKNPYINGDLGHIGFMRCFFFTKKSILDTIDVDLMPKNLDRGFHLPGTDVKLDSELRLDCFGWISLQLILKRLKVTLVPANVLNPDPNLMGLLYEGFKWMHVRQMSSSALGLGGGEYNLWSKGDKQHIINRVVKLFNEDFPGGAAEYIHMKAVSFRLLFFEQMDDRHTPLIYDFAREYKGVLDAVIDLYNLPIDRIYYFTGFYKGVMQI